MDLIGVNYHVVLIRVSTAFLCIYSLWELLGINWTSSFYNWNSIQGLVKGAKLCLNLYFFGWLEKWVGWLLKSKIKVKISETKFLSFYNTLNNILIFIFLFLAFEILFWFIYHKSSEQWEGWNQTEWMINYLCTNFLKLIMLYHVNYFVKL